MENWLLIDDYKSWREVLHVAPGNLELEYPNVNFVEAQTFDKGCELLAQGSWDCVYIDQDLGGGKDDGFKILAYMRTGLLPVQKKMFACSGNPYHKKDMQDIMDSILATKV